MRAPILARLRSRIAGEDGFTMIAVMGAMLSVMGVTAVALAAASGDLEGGAYDRETKQGYAAAEAGLNYYSHLLNRDNTFWANCDQVPDPNGSEPSPVNQVWDGQGADPRVWRNVPDSAAEYTIELLPANGAAACDPDDPAATMIDGDTGTIRIRTTGRVPTGQGEFATRSAITTFRRRSFLDYIYFTDFETSDPAWYQRTAYGLPTAVETAPNTYEQPDLVSWASTACAEYWRNGRGAERYYDADNDGDTDDGRIFYNDDWLDFEVGCTNIQFAPGDLIKGPLHTNDELLVCGSPQFGRTAQDEIEVSAEAPGWRASCSGASPNFVGTFKPNSPILALPPSNSSLEQIADEDYRFTGTTEITLTGSNMIVTNQTMGLSGVSRPLPPNGVIYVQDGVCGETYQALDPYGAPQGCGDVHLKGTYSQDLTIAAEKDILIKDDVLRSGDTFLGLIANQFVRVYHPINPGSYYPLSCTNNGGPGTIRIDAAILALQHSFTVDNYFCGAPTGTLTVNGVIAQKFRGPVGTGGSSISTGYLKDYNYDDRLQTRQPPHFLDPVQSAWRVQRQAEQTSAP